ncbi:MAG: response regulator transcription factor [Bdellovibrionales bacterium]|nr:response regulator transcription factor [Bdellovibrionales bacterium]
MMTGTELSSLKNSKVLILHGKRQKLSDFCQLLREHVAQIFTAISFTDISESDYDLILVDYSVTDMSGILVYKQMTQNPSYALIPSVFIADTKSYDHRLNAFEIGAADFLTRPVDNQDLLQKCQMHIQNRRRILPDLSIHIGNLSLYPGSESAIVNGKSVPLTQLEYKILHFLLSTPRQVVARSEIYEHVWGPDLASSGRLDTQLYNLKKKLAEFNGKIKSVNKVGMRILIAESTFSQEQKKSGQQSQSPGPRL